MHYGILGTTTAHRDDGTPVPLGGARLRALLAALALRLGRPVPAELLAQEVWGGETPQDSAAALQTLVGRLRRTLGRDEVGSGPAGYWLTSATGDLADFQRLAGEGRRALEAGQDERAAELLRAADALWRGPALADLPERPADAVRLQAQRAQARLGRITAELELGRAAELSAELAGLCADRPLDEPLHVLWLRALHRSGRTAEALSRYETLRRALAERLGADPGAGLLQVHQELLSADAPSTAAHRTPVRAATEPQPRPATPGNLRARLTSFVGREQDLEALRELVGQARLVTLTGPGGSGKTRLSVEAGRLAQADGSWTEGVWLAELAPLESPSAIPSAMLSALGLRGTQLSHSLATEAIEGRTEDPVQRIVEHCGRGRMLLILDNCEHLIQDIAELADRLLAECPELTVLATSREPLGVPGEAILPVEPLPDPVALRLLAERGAAARAGFDPAEDPVACAEICRRLDGLPLAIELAAARLRSMTPGQLVERLDGRFALLTGGSRTLLPRQQTLRAVVDWSWELLEERERAVLARLSVFAGGWTLEDAAEVCADGLSVHREQVAELIFSLVDKSLLVAALNPDGPPRYWMLETIHEYAGDRLAEAGDPATALRHLRHFRELVRTADLGFHGPGQLELLALLERERDNIRAALRRAADLGEEQEALVLVLGMSWFWMVRDYRAEARGWYERVMALGPDPFADGAPEPEPLTEGPLDQPLPMSRAVAEEARRQLRMAWLMSLFEGNMEVLGDPAAAELSRRIVHSYRADLPQSFRLPALMRVFAVFLAGEMDSVRPMLDTMVEGCRRHGRPVDLAFALQIRAKMLNDWAGGGDQAIKDGEEALEIFTRLGDRWGMSEAYSALGETAGTRGDSEAAVVAYRRSIELALELDAPQDIPLLRIRLGDALLAQDLEAGERIIREALAEVVRPGNQAANGAMLYGHLVLCAIHASRGEYAAAEGELDFLQEAQVLFGPVVPGVVWGMIECSRAWVVARAGEADRALELLRAGRGRLTEVGPAGVFVEQMTIMLVPAAVGVYTVVAERGSTRVAAERAARAAALLLGAHAALFGPKGSYVERLELERGERRLRELMGEREFEAVHAEGGRLGTAEVAALLDRMEH